jgi:hypothetical protein
LPDFAITVGFVRAYILAGRIPVLPAVAQELFLSAIFCFSGCARARPVIITRPGGSFNGALEFDLLIWKVPGACKFSLRLVLLVAELFIYI